ncbi:hypothetical protein TNCV_3398341 [Trichonephila clavipes]|nr:hypothetical protein TNCV_3398341 [Trichonephila clavipes]
MTSARGHGAIVYCLNSESDDSQTSSHNGERKTRERSPALDGEKGKGPALDRESMRGELCCEKYRIQASPVPAYGINEDLFACVRTAVFLDF